MARDHVDRVARELRRELGLDKPLPLAALAAAVVVSILLLSFTLGAPTRGAAVAGVEKPIVDVREARLVETSRGLEVVIRATCIGGPCSLVKPGDVVVLAYSSDGTVYPFTVTSLHVNGYSMVVEAYAPLPPSAAANITSVYVKVGSAVYEAPVS